MEETVTGTERSCRRRSQNKANAISTLSPHRSAKGGVVYCERRVSLKKSLPNVNTKSSGEAGLGGGGLEGWAVGTCLATEVVRARMEHEKNEGGWGG